MRAWDRCRCGGISPNAWPAATGCRTLVYSRHGYGRSTPLDRPRTVDYMHEEARIWLPAILERLDIRRPLLFGHSDGASIALIHAARPQSDACGVVALAPHVKVEDITVRSIAADQDGLRQHGFTRAPGPLPRGCRCDLLGMEPDLARPRISALGTSRPCCPRFAVPCSPFKEKTTNTERWVRSRASAVAEPRRRCSRFPRAGIPRIAINPKR